MGIQYQKVKSVSKLMLSRGPALQDRIQQTLKTCSDLVGSTLGPGGLTVVIEHQETGVPPTITKDGVTVFRNLGFEDSAAQVLMESARDAAIRTATEAGDGTTTATILAEAFARRTQEFCAANPAISPQRVARVLRELVDTEVLPQLQGFKLQPRLGDPAGRATLHAVARTSANGDTELAAAVLQCFDAIGDAGNVTIAEATGPSKYVVQKIDGYPVPGGYEDSCGPWYQKFVNDPGTQSTLLERPCFILHHGRITDYNTLWPILAQLANLVSDGKEVGGFRLTHNVVVAATGFSESVLTNLAVMFPSEGSLNVYPLLVPMSPIRTGQHDFLADLAALTGARIFDPLEYPLQNFDPEDLGVGPTAFEATRFRSNIIGRRDDILVFERVDQVEKQLGEAAISELERTLLRERVAKLTSGIARLVVQGSSYGDVKERRDRAEDAVCAVRGAIRDGALPGGGAVLAELSNEMAKHGDSEARMGVADDYSSVAARVVAPALLEPVHRLFTNAGYTPEKAHDMALELEPDRIYDIAERRWVDPVKAGVLDSLPAVRDAIRNSASIAAQLGTCGGVVAFQRDRDLERSEARDTAEFLRHAGTNEANERG